MIENIMIGLTIATLICFVVLAFVGTTVSAWYVVVWILPVLVDQINKRNYDRS
jgi:hypothetical protein